MIESQPFQPVVIAPTFNNARTLPRVLGGIDAAGLPIIVVDDGCTDGSAHILTEWQRDGTGRTVVGHPRNRGKAAALQTGFEKAREMGFTHAITIDTDGQLDPAQIGDLLTEARQSPDAIILGSRPSRSARYPAVSRLGRWASNVLLKWESGLRVSDSQCGFRVYPLDATLRLRCRTHRYGFETEILTRAAWAGTGVRECPVSCAYEMPEGRVTHFQPWRDSLVCAAMHIRLLLRSLTPWPVARTPAAAAHDPTTGMIWQRLARWINPMHSWRALRHDAAERADLAKGLAVGVFIANTPFYGIQTLLGFYAARRLRINPVPVVIGSYLSTPPFGPMLIASGIMVGHLVLHGTWPALRNFNPAVRGYGPLLRSVLLEWTVGGLVCGTVLGAATLAITTLLLRCAAHKREGSAVREAAPAATRACAVEESMA